MFWEDSGLIDEQSGGSSLQWLLFDQASHRGHSSVWCVCAFVFVCVSACVLVCVSECTADLYSRKVPVSYVWAWHILCVCVCFCWDVRSL